MRKRRRTEDDDRGYEYHIPLPKSKKRSTSIRYQPSSVEFQVLIEDAMKKRLSTIIRAHLKDNPTSDCTDLKRVEVHRKRVPRYLYDELDEAHGAYWTHNTINRLKLNGLSLYIGYVQSEFDILVEELVKSMDDTESIAPIGLLSSDEQIRSIVKPLGQVIRQDLPDDIRTAIIGKFNDAISDYSDFAVVFAFVVELLMFKFSMSQGSDILTDINNIIPIEFMAFPSTGCVLPAVPNVPTSDNIKFLDYKNLFTLSHLQVINALNFGAKGIQNQTKDNHPLWVEMHAQTDQDGDTSIEKEFQNYIKEAKDINATIKKAAVAQFSISLENMYKDGKRFKKTLDALLRVLLILNLQPAQERKKRELKTPQEKSKNNPLKIAILTRNKKRSLLNQYQKQMNKYQQKQQHERVDRMRRKIEHIKKLKIKRPPKKSPKRGFFNFQSDAEEANESSNEENISYQRLAKLKSRLKWLLYTHKEESINKQVLGVKDISDKEMHVCSELFSFLSLYIPKREEKNWIPAQLPLLVLANKIFEISSYTKYIVKLCPKPKPSTLLCLPVDTAMLFTLLTTFGDTNFDILCKERYAISSYPAALKKKADVFGSIFNLARIKDICMTRKLKFIHRVLVRPGLATCILNGSREISKSTEKPRLQPKETKQQTINVQKLEELEEKANDLKGQLCDKQKAFSLKDADRAIKEKKSARNALSDPQERKTAVVEISKMKQRRWTQFNDIEVLRRKLKDTRCEAHNIRLGSYTDQVLSDTTEEEVGANLVQSLKEAKFSGTDYGLKTMSVTVGISLKMFNAHLNMYNKSHPENPLPVKHKKDAPFLALPKAHKLTAREVTYLSMQNKMRRHLEKRKKSTNLGRSVLAIEKSMSALSKEAGSTELMQKKYFNLCMQKRQELRNFYHSKSMKREQRSVELWTRRTKDRLASRERQYVQQGLKSIQPIMAIGDKGTGVNSRITGYDRRGGKWLQKKHDLYTTTITTSEHLTSQLCLYCYHHVSHPVLGTSRCLNPVCPAFKRGRATNNRDVMSAAAIGISAMTKILLKKDFPPFCQIVNNL